MTVSETSRPHVIPNELMQPGPRVVRLRSRGVGCVAWGARLFILPHTLIGIGFVGFTLFLIWWAVAGVDVEGRVSEKWISHGNKGSTNYMVRHTYGLNGVVHTDEADLDRSAYEALIPGVEGQSSVRVRVMAVGRWHYAKALEPGASPWWHVGSVAMFAAFWNAILSVFVWTLYVVPFRLRRLVKWGRPTEGRVISTTYAGGKNPGYRVEYEFALDDGRPALGSMRVPAAEGEGLSPGTPVTVLHYPGRAKPNVAYELGGYRARGLTW